MPGQSADGVYNHRPWTTQPIPPQEYVGPYSTNQQKLIGQATASILMSGPELQEYVRPNLPQIELFPDKYGYSTEEYGIRDIIELRNPGSPKPQRNESDYSQTPNTQESSSRNALGDSV
jgi:hypothetical protein